MSTGSTERVGVLGGSFDPVHLGHLHVAQGVRRALGLVRVLLLPAANPPHKLGIRLAPADDRETMVRLAIEGQSGLELCAIELRTAGVSYTIDTLRALRRGSPPVDPVFIVGSDSLRQIHSWKHWRDLVREFDLAVIDRPGSPGTRAASDLDPELVSRLTDVPDSTGAGGRERAAGGGHIFLVPLEPTPESASAIRARVARGLPIAELVPPAVAEYIHRTGIYRGETAR